MNSLINGNDNTTGNFLKVDESKIAFVKNMLKEKGMSAEAMVRQICTQRGIDVEQFMSQFK
jgi:hypothetical protein